MLYMLNARRSLRDAERASTGLTDSSVNHPGGCDCRRGQWRPGGPVEVSSLGGVQVQTQKETEGSNYASQHIIYLFPRRLS
jgi:hypothetical protein